MSDTPVRINTAYGLEVFNMLQDQNADYFKRGLRDEFRERCSIDYTIQEKYLEFFLDDEILSRLYPMNEHDTEGFEIFNAQSDVCTALKYFSGEYK